MQQGCRASGGKPLLLERDNPDLLQLVSNPSNTTLHPPHFLPSLCCHPCRRPCPSLTPLTPLPSLLPSLLPFLKFFDDHINANDAHIVDVRRANSPSSAALPIGAVLGSHLIKAEPLLSIVEPGYFDGKVRAAEAAWRQSGQWRRALADALKSWDPVNNKASAGGDAHAVALSYVPHHETEHVALANETTYDEDYEDDFEEE